jgi:hypothetical protein
MRIEARRESDPTGVYQQFGYKGAIDCGGYSGVANDVVIMVTRAKINGQIDREVENR